MKKIILASQSPRRRELIKNLGIDFEVLADNTPEVVESGMAPFEVVCALAEFKGKNVAAKVSSDAIIIAADTVVVADDEILGKPVDEADAERMLGILNGKMHEVYTGVYIVDTVKQKSVTFYEKTEVFFRKLDISEIKGYIKTREPMDKAGAYGIQERGSMFIEKINGDYFNVVGLPLCRLAEKLKYEFGIDYGW